MIVNKLINKKKNKLITGFTIIELIVTIGIIAALAAIVLVSITQYVNTSKNASVKANLASVLVNGAKYYEANNERYGVDATTNFCTNAYFTGPSSAITILGATAICNVNAAYTAWCACSTMKVTSSEPSGSTFCVDSTGAKKRTTTDCVTECPAVGAGAGACQ